MRTALMIVLTMLAMTIGERQANAAWQLKGTYRITAYCPCARCCGKTDGVTADGTYAPGAKERIVSAPKDIPFGTRVWIEGVGEGVVHDRGGAIKGARAEMFFKTHKEALTWGVQNRKFYVWVEDPPKPVPPPDNAGEKAVPKTQPQN